MHRIFAETFAHSAGESNPIGHPCWLLWKALIILYHLFDAADSTHRTALVAKLDTRGIRTPLCLARFSFSGLVAMDLQTPDPDLLTRLWHPDRQDAAPLPLRRPHFGPDGASDFQDLILSLRTDTVDSTSIGREFCELRDLIGVPADFDSLTDAGQCSVIRDSGRVPETVIRFRRLASDRYTIRSFGGSLRASASGMHPYKNFCVFIGLRASPVQTEHVLLRVGLFRTGRTVAKYIANSTKAAIFLGFPTDWLSPAAISVARGLKNSRDLSFFCQNFMFASDLLRRLKSVSLTTEFGQADFLPFLLRLRVPSETHQLRFAADSDALENFPRRQFKALVGVRVIGGRRFFLAKFPWRKNIRSGCILLLPCLCDETEELSRTLCPVHMIWPLISAGGECRGLLFPSLTRSNFDRMIRRNMTDACFPGGERFAPQCFRAGATQEILNAGNPEHRIKSAGFWAGMDFRIYIDAQMTDALGVARLVVSSINSDVEDDADFPIRTPRDDALRRKPRSLPGRASPP